MGIDRRNAMITVGLAALPGLAGAQTVAGDEIIDLWPGPPPGRTDIVRPSATQRGAIR